MVPSQFDTYLDVHFNSGASSLFSEPETINRVKQELFAFTNQVQFEPKKGIIYVHTFGSGNSRLPLICLTFSLHVVRFQGSLEDFLRVSVGDHLEKINSFEIQLSQGVSPQGPITEEELKFALTVWLGRKLSELISNRNSSFHEVATTQVNRLIKQAHQAKGRLDYVNFQNTSLSWEEFKSRIEKINQHVARLKAIGENHQKLHEESQRIIDRMELRSNELLEFYQNFVSDYGFLDHLIKFIEDYAETFELLNEDITSVHARANRELEEAEELSRSCVYLAPPAVSKT